MVGSVIGVGITYQLLRGHSGVSGVDMEQVRKVFTALLSGCLFFLFNKIAG